jgi:hypothetical protein
MSRFGGDGDDSYMPIALWYQAVRRALQGRRGQAALLELRDALESMPTKRLISSTLCAEGDVCALGCLAAHRGVLDPTEQSPVQPFHPDHDVEAWEVAEWARDTLDVTYALAMHIQWQNDEGGWETYVQRGGPETPEQRYERVLTWVREQIGEQCRGDA